MARIRTVKPEFWSSPDTAKVKDPWARLLYIAMWNWADDAGRGVANPKELCGFAFPNDEEIDSAHVRRMLGALRDAYDVVLYEDRGRPYYEIVSWEDHQKIDKRRDGKHPSSEGRERWDPLPQQAPEQRKQPESAQGRRDAPNNRREVGAKSAPEQGNRGTGEQGNSAPSERAANRRGAPTATEPPDDAEHVVGTYDPDDDSRAELALIHSVEPDPKPTATKSQRIKTLTDMHYELVSGQTKYVANRGVIAKFVDNGWTDQQIRDALLRLVEENRILSLNSLRTELTGGPKMKSKPTPTERARRTLAMGSAS